jgi:hypothetical protein
MSAMTRNAKLDAIIAAAKAAQRNLVRGLPLDLKTLADKIDYLNETGQEGELRNELRELIEELEKDEQAQDANAC